MKKLKTLKDIEMETVIVNHLGEKIDTISDWRVDEVYELIREETRN